MLLVFLLVGCNTNSITKTDKGYIFKDITNNKVSLEGYSGSDTLDYLLSFQSSSFGM